MVTPDGLLQQVSTLIHESVIRDRAIAAVWRRCSCVRQHQDAVEPQSSSHSVGDCSQYRNVALVTPHLCSIPRVLTRHTRLHAEVCKAPRKSRQHLRLKLARVFQRRIQSLADLTVLDLRGARLH